MKGIAKFLCLRVYDFEYDNSSIQLSIGSHVNIIYNFTSTVVMNNFYSMYKIMNTFSIRHNDKYEARGCKIISYKVKDSKCVLEIRADIFEILDVSEKREETINNILNN